MFRRRELVHLRLVPAKHSHCGRGYQEDEADPPRLTPGPSISVAHPNPAIPAIEAAIPPVAKLVKTRPSRGAGVNSCSIVQTIGVNTRC